MARDSDTFYKTCCAWQAKKVLVHEDSDTCCQTCYIKTTIMDLRIDIGNLILLALTLSYAILSYLWRDSSQRKPLTATIHISADTFFGILCFGFSTWCVGFTMACQQSGLLAPPPSRYVLLLSRSLKAILTTPQDMPKAVSRKAARRTFLRPPTKSFQAHKSPL